MPIPRGFPQPEGEGNGQIEERTKTARVMMAPLDFDPHRARSAEHQLMAHRFMNWGEIRADLVKRSGLQRQETHIRSDRHLLLMNLKGRTRAGEDFLNGRRVPFVARMPGALTFIPADTEWTGWDEGDASAAYLVVSIGSEFADRSLSRADSLRLGMLRPLIGFRDQIVEQALKTVALELRQPDPMSELVVESQANMVSAQLLRMAGWGHGPVPGGLSPSNLAKIIDMIEANLGQRLSLYDLAQEVNLSTFHLSRTFRRSMGMSPHAFIAKRRLQRAADQLQVTKKPATEIALECGFSSSSHFSTAFKLAFGTTPTCYRRRWEIYSR